MAFSGRMHTNTIMEW